MKLLLICLFAMFALAFGHEADLEFKKTDETGSINRFETVELASNDEPMKKRWWGRRRKPAPKPAPKPKPKPSAEGCESGSVKSKYCTTPAANCFGRGQIVGVTFQPAFKTAPKVVIGFNLIDTNKDQNVRIRASVEQVTKSGFNIRFSPWDRSITYQIGVNWMACP